MTFIHYTKLGCMVCCVYVYLWCVTNSGISICKICVCLKAHIIKQSPNVNFEPFFIAHHSFLTSPYLVVCLWCHWDSRFEACILYKYMVWSFWGWASNTFFRLLDCEKYPSIEHEVSAIIGINDPVWYPNG